MMRGLVISLGLALPVALTSGCSRTPVPVEAQASTSAVAVGAMAPEAQLIGTTGAKLALADLLHQHAQTVVVFYRGFW
jgi:uncharacterized protein YcfL